MLVFRQKWVKKYHLLLCILQYKCQGICILRCKRLFNNIILCVEDEYCTVRKQLLEVYLYDSEIDTG